VKNYLTKESAEEFFRYDNKTGKLFWKQRDRKHFSRDIDWKMFNTRFAGKEASSTTDQGYILTRFAGMAVRAHKIVWLMHNGYWPEHQIDHINGSRSDNRIENLRKATNAENSANRNGSKSNSGYKGVHFLNKQEKYIAYITKNYNRYNLGRFDTPEEAHASYCAKAVELFGEYANFGT
jgi:hypothetical protein